MREIRAIDICAGGGGWAVAARGTPIRIVAAFDRDEDCLATYEFNHPDVDCMKCDVTTYDFSRWSGVDLILGGIPCNHVSVARNLVPLSQASHDEIQTLVNRMISLPDQLGVKYWCYEDVIQIRRFLPPLTPYFTLDSQFFCGQRRKRIYIGTMGPPKINRQNDSILESYLRSGPYRISRKVLRSKPVRSKTYTHGTFSSWDPAKKSPTVISLPSRHDNYAAVAFPRGHRQLEWQELAGLQGFPDDYTFIGSLTKTYLMIGQAVQIDTARAILQRFIEDFSHA